MTAHQNGHSGCETRQMHRRLPGRIPTTDYEDLLATRRRSLRDSGSVVDACAHQLLECGHPDTTIGDAMRKDNRATSDFCAVGHAHDEPTRDSANRGGLPHESNVRPERPRLSERS